MHFLRKYSLYILSGLVVGILASSILMILIYMRLDIKYAVAEPTLTPTPSETPTPTVITLEPTVIVVTPTPTVTPTATPEPTFTAYDFIPLDPELQTAIYELCEAYDFEYDMALALMYVESRFKTDAVGDNGNATGLCQIWAYWWGDLADAHGLDLNEPVDNVEVMLLIMRHYLNKRDGNLTEALQCYNSGQPTGTTYADKIYKYYDEIQKQKEAQ